MVYGRYNLVNGFINQLITGGHHPIMLVMKPQEVPGSWDHGVPWCAVVCQFRHQFLASFFCSSPVLPERLCWSPIAKLSRLRPRTMIRYKAAPCTPQALKGPADSRVALRRGWVETCEVSKVQEARFWLTRWMPGVSFSARILRAMRRQRSMWSVLR